MTARLIDRPTVVRIVHHAWSELAPTVETHHRDRVANTTRVKRVRQYVDRAELTVEYANGTSTTEPVRSSLDPTAIARVEMGENGYTTRVKDGRTVFSRVEELYVDDPDAREYRDPHDGHAFVMTIEDGTPRRTIRVPDHTWRAARVIARRRGETVSDVVRRALSAYIEHNA